MNLLGTLKVMSRRGPLVHFVRPYQMLRSVMRGGSGASPQKKQGLIREFAKGAGIEIFVETGTYLGDTLWALKGDFKELYSIELDRRLYEAACRRFAKHNSVHLFCGDSAEILPKLLLSVREPVLFWLDAHYSGGITAGDISRTPVIRELDCILFNSVKGHIILIDDAANFGTDPSYPSMTELKKYCFDQNPKNVLEFRDGIIIFSINN